MAVGGAEEGTSRPEGLVRLLEIDTGRTRASFRCSYAIDKMVFSPDWASLAAIGEPMPGVKGTEQAVVFLWDIASLGHEPTP